MTDVAEISLRKLPPYNEEADEEGPHNEIYFGECWFCGKEVFGRCMVMESGEIECVEHWDKTVDV